jgi:hypothetical protein
MVRAADRVRVDRERGSLGGMTEDFLGALERYGRAGRSASPENRILGCKSRDLLSRETVPLFTVAENALKL